MNVNQWGAVNSWESVDLVDYTLLLTSGNYGLSGGDLSLLSSRSLTPEQGTYSSQGTEVGLLKDYLLPLETNS